MVLTYGSLVSCDCYIGLLGSVEHNLGTAAICIKNSQFPPIISSSMRL